MNLLPRKENPKELGIPGAITSYYREISSGDKFPGMNVDPYTLFSLKTRVEHDKRTARWIRKNSGRIVLQRFHHEDVMRYFLTLNRVPKSCKVPDYLHRKVTAETYIPLGNKDTETVTPRWLQKKVTLYTNEYKNYCAILSDRYPISDLPDYWLNQILPRIDISGIVKNTIYPPQNYFSFNPDNVGNYDWFFNNGVFYVRLVDPDNEDNYGSLTPEPGDLLNTGEQAIVRSEEYYGDYSNYQRRYHDIQYNIIKELKKMYSQGYMVLDKVLDKEFIENWELIEDKTHIDIFFPGWKDTRITQFDGVFNFLRRQSLEWKSQWDYKFIFIKISPGDIVKHNISRWYLKKYSTMALFLNNLIILQFKNLKETIESIDYIETISSESFGNVEISISKTSKLQNVASSSMFLSGISSDEGIFIDFSYQKIPLITKKVDV